MLRKFISRSLNPRHKLALKSAYYRTKGVIVKHFRSYDAEDLEDKLKAMGIQAGDTLLVHSNTNPHSGFSGGPPEVIKALIDTVGQEGNLLMVSIPFQGSAYDYLSKGRPFYKDKTISMMGLISEIFRRTEGVKRSLSATHPVLAFGKDSDWIVANHERCRFPCGKGSPFEKFHRLHGKILCYDVGFGAITFFHYVEDLTQHMLPFPVYHGQPFHTEAYDDEMNAIRIETYVFNGNVKREAHRLEEEMKKRGLIRYDRIGNSGLILIKAEDVVTCQTEMIKAGNLPYSYKQS
ncbi:MAG: AAC(3) family N-acetyltransferase [Gammaproteobacteria bacterium]